ncbi:hypothetical protein [Hydrogenoanaerobacterium sp.]|uniref:hypothetical protein n=1 Tax=Hydrogenoanaerobacterium sp. TaxID=2953763 RepID=UPI00289D6AD3|nr:hypothetical protein [Hydrogenoanaerobacterium sp.]
MPMYLKRNTIRYFEASVDAISLAVTALGLPQRHEIRESTSKNAVAIGLAGVSAELAMSAIIVQAQGEKALLHPSGFYKTGTHIVDDFRKLINSQIPKMLFLTQGIKDPAKHISNILNTTSKFKLLTKARAGGLHAGIGPSRDVCIACVNDVITFIDILGESSRIKTYTLTVPRKIEMPKSYDLIIDDMISKVAKSSSDIDKANALASVYLVVPELPDQEPDWFPAFERLCIAPKTNDISFLLETLETSKYASLIKVSKSQVGMPVVIQKGNPSTLPIEPQYLKKSFSNIRDQVYADRGTANGRLDQNQFDPPPIESVYEVFAFQFYLLGITQFEEEVLTSVDTWPFIAASLSYTGTLGPYWYFVRMTSDLDQLKSYISRAAKIGGGAIHNGVLEFTEGFKAIKDNKFLSKSSGFAQKLIEQYEKSGEKRKNLIKLYSKNRNNDKYLCEDAKTDLYQICDEDKPVGEMLVKLAERTYKLSSGKSYSYWARVICEAAVELEDAQGLLAILKSTELSVAHTAAKKALRVIDFINFGPKIE